MSENIKNKRGYFFYFLFGWLLVMDLIRLTFPGNPLWINALTDLIPLYIIIKFALRASLGFHYKWPHIFRRALLLLVLMLFIGVASALIQENFSWKLTIFEIRTALLYWSLAFFSFYYFSQSQDLEQLLRAFFVFPIPFMFFILILQLLGIFEGVPFLGTLKNIKWTHSTIAFYGEATLHPGIFRSPDSCAWYFLVALACNIGLFFTAEKKSKWLLLTCAILCTAGIFIAGKRAKMIWAVVIWTYVIMRFISKRKIFMLIPIFLAIIGICSYLYSYASNPRLRPQIGLVVALREHLPERLTKIMWTGWTESFSLIGNGIGIGGKLEMAGQESLLNFARSEEPPCRFVSKSAETVFQDSGAGMVMNQTGLIGLLLHLISYWGVIITCWKVSKNIKNKGRRKLCLIISTYLTLHALQFYLIGYNAFVGIRNSAIFFVFVGAVLGYGVQNKRKKNLMHAH